MYWPETRIRASSSFRRHMKSHDDVTFHCEAASTTGCENWIVRHLRHFHAAERILIYLIERQFLCRKCLKCLTIPYLHSRLTTRGKYWIVRSLGYELPIIKITLIRPWASKKCPQTSDDSIHANGKILVIKTADISSLAEPVTLGNSHLTYAFPKTELISQQKMSHFQEIAQISKLTFKSK